MNTLRTALITGATGYIGSHLCHRLVSDGWQVHIIIRSQSNTSILEDIETNLTIHQHDGTTNSMFNIVSNTKPDIVFHLASLFISEHQPENIENLITSNILLGVQLVEAMTAFGCLRLVNTGTAWQHFKNEIYNPVNLYAATKQAFEDILKFYSEANNLNVITLKLFDTYGPNDPRPKLLPYINKTLQSNEPLNISPGEQLINLVYIDDVVEAFVIAGKRLFDGKLHKFENFAVSSTETISLRNLLKMVGNITSYASKIKWGSRSYRKREVITPWDKYRTLPSWKPQILLKEGLVKTFSKK